ncbi:MAG TPA: IS1595 family transposase [Caulobacteraceae bacterium]|nr:IS1595 family transposase [Caulobacteraceae bacterium]
MAKSALSAKFFHDEAAAYAWLEGVVWPDGPVCPHCGGVDRITVVGGTTGRMGLKRCLQCKKQFTVTVGTVFERSHVKLHLWLQAAHLICSSKKGMSSMQISRILGVTYKTAWFMTHRLRAAMGLPDEEPPLGGEGKVIEADTTFVGGREPNKHVGKRNPKNIGGAGKAIVHVLVERGGRARAHHIADVTGNTLRDVMTKHASRKSALMTDTHGGYHHIGKEFARHEMVDHGKDEYVRGDVYSNTAEGYFAILKRGVYGTFHHVSEAHLHRYLAEFDFRYSNRQALGVDDADRTVAALRGIVGKRLTYRDSSASAATV